MRTYIFRTIPTFFPLLLFISIEIILRVSDVDFITPIRIVHLAGDWREHHIFTDRDFIPDPYLFWRANPKSKSVNSKGFIGPEISIIKPNKTFRIFCLGDSNTMGTKDSSYPGELSDLLQKKQISNMKFEVINAGMSGYTSLQGLRLCSEIMGYNPDLVIISFGWNDTVYTYRKPDRAFKPGNKYLLSLERFLYNFKVYQFLRYVYFKSIYPIYPDRISSEITRRVTLEDYEENLTAMVNLAKQNKTKLLFITRPWILGVEKKTWVKAFIKRVKIYNSINKVLAAGLNIDLIDAEKIFLRYPEYFADACHFNNSGNKLLAREIYNYLERNYEN